MASPRSIEVKVGVLILTALGLLAVFILIMGGINFQPTYSIFVDFDNPGGLQNGAPVKIAGVKVGKISEIAFRGGNDPQTGKRQPLVRLTVQIEKRYAQSVHQNSLFYVTNQSVLGEQFLAIEPGSADIGQRLAVPPPRKWRLDVGNEVSDLTNGLGDWTDSSAGLAYRLSPRTTISGHARLATRFGYTDVQIEGRIDQAFTPAFSAYALAAATPDADFLARYSIGAGASWQVVAPAKAFGPLSFNIDARYDDFADTSVTSIQPWVQGYILDGRLGLSARWVHAQDDIGTRADGYVLRADLAVTPRLNVFAGYADAPEIDDGALIPTRSVFGGISFDVSDTLTLHASAAHEQRPTFDRNIFGLGLTARF